MKLMEEQFLIHGFDLDRTGVVPPEGYMRLLEALRWRATIDRDHPISRLAEGGNRFVVRAQLLEVRTPARMGQRLRANMWLSRVGRTSFDVAHQIFRLDEDDGEEEIVRARTVAVHVSMAGLPAPVPPEVSEHVTDGPLPEAPVLKSVRSPVAFAHRVLTRPSDTDLLQHLNQALYGALFEDARQVAVQAGALPEGYGERTRAMAIDFNREAYANEELTVHVWALSGEPGAVGLEITRGDEPEPIARGRVEVGEAREEAFPRLG